MGVVHKLNLEVRNFIIEQKSSNPALSCRKLTALVLNNYKIDLSKSSINMIIKEAGLSAPIGRTPKKKKKHIVMPQLPVLLEDISFGETRVLEDERHIREAAEAEKLRLAKLEEERKLREEEFKRAQEEKLAQEKAQALEEKRRQEEIKKAQEEKEAEEKIKAEADRLKALQLEEEKKRQEEELKKVREEEARKAQEEIRKAQEEEARRARDEEVNKAKEEELKREEEARLRAEEERLKALQIEEEKKRQEELKRAQEEEIRRARDEEINKAKEEELKREEEARLRAEEETARKAEEERLIKLAGEQRGAPLSNEKLPQLENTGIVFLRAIDSIIGISRLIAAAIKNRFSGGGINIDDLTENIIYLPLLQGKIEKALEDKLNGYLNEIEGIKGINLDISRIMGLSLQEARCVRVGLFDGTALYLDGQFYSVWSSPYIPYDFASPVYNLKKQIDKYFNTDSPVILFNAPGYDIPSQEFFSFLAGLEAKENSINNLTIYGNKLKEIEILPVSQAKKHYFIFGVWPWQFTECRKVKSIGDFRMFHLAEQEKDVFIADIEMEIRHPGTGKQISLKGCVLKTNPAEKTRLVILSNFSREVKKSEELVSLYLNHWPNLDEAFQDYSHKIELFTYTANSQRFFDPEHLNLGLTQTSSVKDLFRNYLKALDAYARWHFLPAGYEDKELSVAKERFYDLGVRLKNSETGCRAEFVLPEGGYSFDKDLAYLCRRINEREILLDGKRFLAQA